MLKIYGGKIKESNMIMVMFDLLLHICGHLDLEEEVKSSLDKYNIEWIEI